MKLFRRRQAIIILRILLIITILFQHNILWVDAQNSPLGYNTISLQASNSIVQKNTLATSLPDDFLQFPFETGVQIRFSGDVHTWNRRKGILSGIDIIPLNAKVKIVAPARGRIKNKSSCWLYIDFENGWAVRLLHITNISVAENDMVERNQPIAELAQNVDDGVCWKTEVPKTNYWQGAHVHMDILYYGQNFSPYAWAPLKNKVFSRWRIQYEDLGNLQDIEAKDFSTILINISTQEKVGFIYQQRKTYPGIEFSLKNNGVCPSPKAPDNIILYSEPNYGCKNKSQIEGGYISISLSSTNIIDQPIAIPNHFGASSISIPPNWHVILQQQNAFDTRQALRCRSDNSFINDLLVGSLTCSELNNNVNQVLPYAGECTDKNSPPGEALLLEPPNESLLATTTAQTQIIQSLSSTLSMGIAPTLRWSNQGDAEGEELRFYVEVIGSDKNINSGWIDNITWRPTILDRQPGKYQWHVKARDSRGAESDWSKAWTFTIQTPNKQPSITFTSANWDTFSSGIIYSKNQNWTFTGTASDPEGQLTDVQWRCSGDNCGSTASHTGTNSWAHTQNSMSGRNDVYFVAYDSYGNNMPSRHLDLRIDLAAPTTMPGLNGQSNSAQWPTWFTGPVKVNLHSGDNGTGRALVGMGKIHYRLGGGAWQVVSGSDTNFTISADGSHTVEYYSEDALGNTEAVRSFSFKIDQTPPTLPTNLTESHGVTSDQWQKTQNIPVFTWNPATDNLSGLRGYQFYFGQDPNGIGYKDILVTDLREYTPFPAGVPTGTYYLRARTQDVAGNWSAWATLFTFRYDNTPPENPTDITHAAKISTDWQKSTSQANFSWTAAHDEGSGVKGYYAYWGSQPDGISSSFITANSYQNLTPLCAVGSACTGYLRLRSQDNAGNLAEDWNTVFILRYDNAPPLLDFSFNNGASTTNQSQVTLDVTSTDEGSGVYAARFSLDGQNWTEWEQPASERLFNIPPISRQSWPVYAQVIDGVGLLSSIVQHEIYLDVNRVRPASLNFQIFDQALSAGSGSYASSSYSGRGTLGQVTDAPVSTSAHYSLSNGYEAGSQAIPLVVPGHDEYTTPGGLFGSGKISPPMQSAHYQAILTNGGIGLPASTTISSGSYRHQPGFLAGIKLSQHNDIPFTQVVMPPPDSKVAAACDAPLVSINGGAVYTDSPNISLSLCAPFATEMMLSDREDFAGAEWQPFASVQSWTLSTAVSTVAPQFVYAQYKDADGKIHATYFDDILYDPNQPGGELMLSDDLPLPMAPDVLAAEAVASNDATITPPPALDGTVTLYVDGYDDNSGLSQMQLSEDITFANATWQPFAPVVNYLPGAENGPKIVYARFQDEAGNLSATTTINFIYDTLPPIGYIFADSSVISTDAITITLYLGDYSMWSEDPEAPAPTFDGGAIEMRLGTDPTLANAPWQPLADSVTVPIDPTQPEGAYYAQFRDAAGNISEITSASYYIDTLAPDLSAAAEPGDGTDRTLNIYATDNLSGIANLYLSNDPLMEQNVVTMFYTDTLTWSFDERKVVWIVAEDGVGNRSEPYPVYATDLPPNMVEIAGNVGVADATISYTDTATQTVTSDSNGNYSISVPDNWIGTVAVTKAGYAFVPASKNYTGIQTSLDSENYTAYPLTKFIAVSVASQDGWALESSETSNQGGSINSTLTTFRLGDDAAKKQYRAILSFNTANIPDSAVIASVSLKIRKQGSMGTGDPFTIFQGLLVDIKRGNFNLASLEAKDFQFAPNITYGPFKPVPISNWYTMSLDTAMPYVNKVGNTQLRLRFKLDDNNNSAANYMSFFSSNYTTVSNRPQLIVEYYIP
jgi:hypothetical protein